MISGNTIRSESDKNGTDSCDHYLIRWPPSKFRNEEDDNPADPLIIRWGTRADRKLRRVRNLGDYPLARFIQPEGQRPALYCTLLCVPDSVYLLSVFFQHRLISQALQWPGLQWDKKALGPVYLALPAQTPCWEGWDEARYDAHLNYIGLDCIALHCSEGSVWVDWTEVHSAALLVIAFHQTLQKTKG